MLEQGPVEQTIIKACMRDGIPLPKKIAEAPELQLGLELYFSAYLDLMTSRNPDSAISWATMMGYARAYEFDEEQTDDLIFYVQRLDGAHMKWARSQAPKGPPGGNPR